ncbi:hypothetical protein A3BBH6_10730 [Alistipes onderdonkii subsp. vulgaris]|jgi:hypothetical protein|nr:hypothetical protein A3BBH6_10730 [Alistipes onderdonkii subsp. vulgaris]
MSMYQKIVVCNFTEEELREIWRDTYCYKVIKTHDGIRVHFYESNFDHAFYESSKRNQSRNKKKSKDILSSERLSRILWIKDVLEDPTAKMYVGFDNKTKRYDRTKRVAVAKGNYVVVIQIYAERKANFITAYVASNSIDKIEQSPRW